ncbi:hypothetical protein SK128_025712 [Halocaridina rubra]|uniref:G-protein coupled receptors family 2 profile 2 domain-containing protein n=1 Tax=Halocaridina rubra TaxID=373956 RepID=A0AAN8XKX3_HALRR
MAIRRVLLLLWLQYFATFVTSMENDFNGNDNCEGFSCIRKCCPDDKFINITTCDVPPDKSHLWTPTFYDGTVPTLMGKSPNVKYLYGVMNCEAYPIQPHINADDIFYLQTTGKLYVPLYGRYYDPDTYCIDKLYVNEDNSEEIALLCFEEESLTHAGVPCLIVKNYVYPVLLLVSWIFLFIALIVYVWIAELRTKLHGRCQISFLSSMVIGYALVLISYVALDMPAILCSFFAFLKHINLLASFFWLNVMCFDIWKSLKSMRPAAESNHKSRSRFYLYSFYAWGCPIFIGIVSEVIDNLPNTFTHLIRPGFVNEMHTCWFGSNKAMWLYFYMFVLILVICNIFFFSHVIYIIFKSENNQQLQAARSRNRDRLWLYVRIFLVMGISWITEVISFSEGSCMGWIVTDIINALQGVIIFVLFVCKKGTRSKVIKKAKMSSFATSSRRLLNYSRRSQMTSSMNVTITTQYTDASSSIDQTK